MPRTLTFADCFGFELTNDADDDAADDDRDSDYNPADDDSDDDADDDHGGYGAGSDDDDNDDNDNDDADNDPDEPDDRILRPAAGPTNNGETTRVPAPTADGGTTGVNRTRVTTVLENDKDEDSETEEDDGPAAMPKLIPRLDDSDDDSDDDDEPPDNAGVETIRKTGVSENDKEEAEAEMQKKYGTRKHSKPLRRRQPRKYAPRYDDSDTTMAQFDQPMGMLFMTEQMSLKRGLKLFGKAGADKVVEELKQIEISKVFKPKKASDLTHAQKRAALEHLMYLKQKRCGRIKARGCADGRKQRLYKTKQETSSPTVTTEALFITLTIDTEERRKVITVDIPGAFMHSNMDELVHVRLSGPMATLLVRVDPEKYRKFVVKDKTGNATIYVELTKALYGTCQAALLLYKNLSSFLVTNSDLYSTSTTSALRTRRSMGSSAQSFGTWTI
jgi:hypothetical protein